MHPTFSFYDLGQTIEPMREENTPSLQHILVALDGSPHSQAALDAAVRLAATVEAEVEGLFVEDETLRRAAQLPFAQEVRAYTAAPKRLSDQRLQRQLRYRAEYAKHTLQRMAEQADVPYAFRTVEGHVTQELLRAAAETDLLILGKTSTAGSRRRLGSTSRTLLSDAPSSVMVLRKTVPAQQPLLLYYDGSDAAETALALAVQVSHRAGGTPIQLLLPPPDPDADLEHLREQIRTRYGHVGVPLHEHQLTSAESHRLSAFAREKEGLVLLPAGCPPLCSTSWQQFLYELDRPLLVVR
jgi:nucleotide-binding universal stress UspA family protein